MKEQNYSCINNLDIRNEERNQEISNETCWHRRLKLLGIILLPKVYNDEKV